MILGLISCIIMLTYAVLIIVVSLGWWKLKRFSHTGPEPKIKLSVIVAVRNEAGNILPLLNSLLKQDYPSALWEIIIVNDHSTDDTYQLAEKAIATLPPDQQVKLLSLGSNDSFGKKAALDFGIRLSVGELVVITDADCTAGVSWLTALASFYEENKPQMILGPVKMTDSGTFFGKLQSLEFMSLLASAAGTCNAGFPLLANGANIAFTRQGFDSCGGFSGNMQFPSGDDMFLMMRIKKKFGSGSIHFLKSASAVVSTPVINNLNSFLQQRMRWVSKSRGYTDTVLIAVSILVFLTNTILFSSAIASLFFPGFLKLFIVLFLIKLLVDLPLLYSFSRFQKSTALMWLFPIMEIVNAVYTFFIGIAGNIGKYEWKGRKS